jgi:hypothetical protein
MILEVFGVGVRECIRAEFPPGMSVSLSRLVSASSVHMQIKIQNL